MNKFFIKIDFFLNIAYHYSTAVSCDFSLQKNWLIQKDFFQGIYVIPCPCQ